jgi:hypothetical protein
LGIVAKRKIQPLQGIKLRLSILYPVGFEVLTAVSTEMAVFWVLAIFVILYPATSRRSNLAQCKRSEIILVTQG